MVGKDFQGFFPIPRVQITSSQRVRLACPHSEFRGICRNFAISFVSSAKCRRGNFKVEIVGVCVFFLAKCRKNDVKIVLYKGAPSLIPSPDIMIQQRFFFSQPLDFKNPLQKKAFNDDFFSEIIFWGEKVL